VAAPDVPDGVAVPASVRRSLARHRLPD
jgi:hypothetical protein